MGNKTIISAIAGGTFFAIPYLGLTIGLVPSLAIGASAFGASELILNSMKPKHNLEELKDTNISLYQTLINAKKQNEELMKMVDNIEDMDMKKDIKEISETADKIIKTVQEKPDKANTMNRFFDYYLPVTLKIVKRYDEIENQRLKTDESKEFMKNAKNMLSKTKIAFDKQLSSLYQSDIIDTDADMKVFETMLKSDGFDENEDFKISKNTDENK